MTIIVLIVCTIFVMRYLLAGNLVDCIASLLILATGIFFALLCPIYYQWREDGSLVYRLLICRRIYRPEEYEMREVTDLRKRITMRLFGSGGYFGWTGYFGIHGQKTSLLLLANLKAPVLELRRRDGRGRSTFVNAQ